MMNLQWNKLSVTNLPEMGTMLLVANKKGEVFNHLSEALHVRRQFLAHVAEQEEYDIAYFATKPQFVPEAVQRGATAPVGVVAQEVAEVLPEAVLLTEDAADEPVELVGNKRRYFTKNDGGFHNKGIVIEIDALGNFRRWKVGGDYYASASSTYINTTCDSYVREGTWQEVTEAEANELIWPRSQFGRIIGHESGQFGGHKYFQYFDKWNEDRNNALVLERTNSNGVTWFEVSRHSVDRYIKDGVWIVVPFRDVDGFSKSVGNDD